MKIVINKNHLVAGIVLVIVVIGIILAKSNTAGDNTGESLSTEGITKGKIAKDFSLTTIDGNVVRLSDFRGKYVLFAIMATWCTPCQIEAQNVKTFQDKHKDLPLVVMQIDVDPRETMGDLVNFRERIGRKDWIMGFDDRSITSLYDIRAFDTTLVVDPEGKIIYRDNGFPIDTKTLEDLIIKGESMRLELGSTHEHANIKVTIDGQQIDFSKTRYQLRSSFIHFEDGDGETVHVHAKGVTLNYLFETLGWKHSFKLDGGSCLKTDFGEFCDGKLIVIVNDEDKNLDYEIKDNDVIEVRYE